ncbi:hypothetical protein MSAN_01395400 [Mycena sanguinolenta]|uniref:Uncharacterized protein n=1 Tax=Mycena sanguinolenta TaxID=230812 RepID=A0A8H6Y9U7_9AGAR|nr:hypothetical protein MSAN_01395400 [Mycena sanguinolenta]
MPVPDSLCDTHTLPSHPYPVLCRPVDLPTLTSVLPSCRHASKRDVHGGRLAYAPPIQRLCIALIPHPGRRQCPWPFCPTHRRLAVVPYPTGVFIVVPHRRHYNLCPAVIGRPGHRSRRPDAVSAMWTQSKLPLPRRFPPTHAQICALDLIASKLKLRLVRYTADPSATHPLPARPYRTGALASAPHARHGSLRRRSQFTFAPPHIHPHPPNDDRNRNRNRNHNCLRLAHSHKLHPRHPARTNASACLLPPLSSPPRYPAYRLFLT